MNKYRDINDYFWDLSNRRIEKISEIGLSNKDLKNGDVFECTLDFLSPRQKRQELPDGSFFYFKEQGDKCDCTYKDSLQYLALNEGELMFECYFQDGKREVISDIDLNFFKQIAFGNKQYYLNSIGIADEKL